MKIFNVEISHFISAKLHNAHFNVSVGEGKISFTLLCLSTPALEEILTCIHVWVECNDLLILIRYRITLYIYTTVWISNVMSNLGFLDFIKRFPINCDSHICIPRPPPSGALIDDDGGAALLRLIIAQAVFSQSRWNISIPPTHATTLPSQTISSHLLRKNKNRTNKRVSAAPALLRAALQCGARALGWTLQLCVN